MPSRAKPQGDTHSRRPVLIVVAGPNGAGKTSLTQAILRHRWLEGCVYVNPDEIAQDRFGDWNSPEAVLQAARHAESIREDCLAAGRSLAFETVFSTENKLSFVRRASDRGFFVRLFYVSTDDPSINAARITDRVRDGGHDVPIAKIITRFDKSLRNLREILPEVDRGYVYDNSAEGVLPALQFRTVSGAVQKVYTEEHRWSDDLRACMLQTRPVPRTVANPRKALPQDGPERSRGRSKPTVR